MRVIAGTAKGRRLKGPRGIGVRPTADRVKEALFSILQSRFDLRGAVVLDLFAGTGSMGVEALSRGAARVVFVEQDRRAAAIVKQNIAICGFAPQAELRVVPVHRALATLASGRARFDGVFADPPYGKGLLGETLGQLATADILRPGAWVIVEGRIDDDVAEEFGPLRLTQTRRYGKTKLMLFLLAEAAGEGLGR